MRPSLSIKANAARGAQVGAGLALGMSLVSCSGGTVAWRIRFENRADAMATRVVEARVRRGTCDGEIVWQGRVSQGQALDGMGIPQLSDGLYAFEAVARDASCQTLASDCILAAAPFGGPVVLELPSRPLPAACAAPFCTDGTCTDADGGMRDAGLDAAPDAASPVADAFTADDAGPPDAFVVPDAFVPPDAFIPPASAPLVVAPWNGVMTGSPAASAMLVDPPLRPLFIWEPVADAASYRLEFTRCALANWRDCTSLPPDYVEDLPGGIDRGRPSIDLPVSSVAPVGARYVFRVGACATVDHRGCAYSAPRYIDVGRAWADLDGNGAADLVGITSGDGFYRVMQMRVDPPLSTPRVSSTSALNSLVAIGDYDGDGVGELVARSASAPGGSYVFIDNFALGSSVEESVAMARLGNRIVPAGDLNADGFADFVVTAPGLGLVRVQLGRSVFTSGARIDVPPTPSRTDFGFEVCGAGDVNQDGRADLAIAMLIDPTTAEIRYYTVQADGSVIEVPRMPVVRVATGLTGPVIDGLPILRLVCGADIDGNGRPETIVGRFRLSEVVIRDDASLALTDSGSFGAAIAWGDYDGVGVARIFAARTGRPRAPANGTGLLRIATDRTMALTDFDTSVELIQANADFDGDGRDDVVFRSDPNIRVITAGISHTFGPPAGTTWLSMGD